MGMIQLNWLVTEWLEWLEWLVTELVTEFKFSQFKIDLSDSYYNYSCY
jgi:hypothetical protein